MNLNHLKTFFFQNIHSRFLRQKSHFLCRFNENTYVQLMNMECRFDGAPT